MNKKIKRFLFDVFAPFFFKPVQKINWRVRTLIIKDDALGDFLLFTGVLVYLLRFWEQKTIYLAVNKRIAPIAELFLPADRIIAIDFKQYENSNVYKKELIEQLRSIGFETVIASIHRSSVCNNLVKHCGAKIKYGYEKELLFKNRHFNVYNKKILSFDRVHQEKDHYTHVIDHERYFASAIIEHEISLSDAQPLIHLPGQTHAEDTEQYFVFLPEAGDMKRAYPHNASLKLIQELYHLYNIKCLVLGSGQGYDASIFDQAYTNNLLGKTSLLEALYKIKKALFVVGNETGLTHAAWIMNIPTVMIYGGGHYGRFLPTKTSGQLAVHPMKCFCCDWNCMYQDSIVPCISRITERDILENVTAVMNQRRDLSK